MQNSITQTYTGSLTIPQQKKSTIKQFLNWCQGQEVNRFGWVAASLALHGCVLTPITILAIGIGGASFGFIMAAIVAMGMCLIVNLAAMPTRIIIPVFFFTVLVDIVLIIASLSGGLNMAGLNI